MSPLKTTYKNVPGYRWSREYNASLVNTSEFAQIYLVNDNANSDIMFQRSNLSNLPTGHADTPYVLLASNRGRSFKLFDNPNHKEELKRMGLTAENAFSCAFFYLFQPNARLQGLYSHLWQALSSLEPQQLKIGLRVRVGDADGFRSSGKSIDGEALLAKHMHFFQCAEQIEQNANSSSSSCRVGGHCNRSVIWFLISDSLELRLAARRRFGDKLLTDVSHRPLHTYCPVNLHPASNLCSSEEGMRNATLLAAGSVNST